MEPNSPSFEAGLRDGDLITHINDESVQSLLHTQVVHLLSSGTIVNIRAVPLDKTSIKEGSRRKGNPGKMARRSLKKRQQREKVQEKKKGRNLLRRLSAKKTEPLFPHSPHISVGRQQFTPLNRSCSSGDAIPSHGKLGRSPPISVPWSPDSSQAGSSTSSSPSSSTPNSPATQATSATAHLGRPSSLQVAKHKKTASLKSPHRRKSVHNFPLSPLARTPSPSTTANPPARSPSPLTLHHGHQVGSCNQPQQTIPSHLNTSSILHHSMPLSTCKKPVHMPSPITTHSSPATTSSPQSNIRIPPERPNSGEQGSPIKCRISSPERLHPSSASQRSSGSSGGGMDKLPPPHRKVSLQERSLAPHSEPN